MQSITEVTVGSIMQRNVLSVEDDWPMNRLASFLTDNQISGAPVTGKNGKLVGVVSLTDIVRYDSSPEGRESSRSTHEYYLHTLESHVASEEARTYHVEHDSATKVRDIMTPMIFEIPEDATVQEAADTMVKGHIHRLLVTKNKQISGIVTALDILKVVRTAAEGGNLGNVA